LEHLLDKSQEVGAETGAAEVVLGQVIGKVRLNVNGPKLLKLPLLPVPLKPSNHATILYH